MRLSDYGDNDSDDARKIHITCIHIFQRQNSDKTNCRELSKIIIIFLIIELNFKRDECLNYTEEYSLLSIRCLHIHVTQLMAGGDELYNCWKYQLSRESGIYPLFWLTQEKIIWVSTGKYLQGSTASRIGPKKRKKKWEKSQNWTTVTQKHSE